MNFSNIANIQQKGFQGFIKIGEFLTHSKTIPCLKGIYLVLYDKPSIPEFLSIGTGGYYNNKNPNVSIEALRLKWVNGTKVIYIGKAGGKGNKSNLNSRLKQYIKFGQGCNIAHWGGRYIWQIKNSQDLILCWKLCDFDEPRCIESRLIQEFSNLYGKKPFANVNR